MNSYENMIVFNIFIPIIIVSIVVLTITYGYRDGFRSNTRQVCPDLLIESRGTFYLYNSKMSNIPGINPLVFNTLDDYIEFTKWQEKHDVKCPMIYMKEMCGAQGKYVYKSFHSPTDLSEGSPVVDDVRDIISKMK